MSADVCKLTGSEGKYVRAHIIPRGFYHFEDELPIVAFTNRPETRAKRVPIGIYDEGLVVADTEKMFAKWDDHAINVLRPGPQGHQLFKDQGAVAVGDNGLPLAYEIRDFDYAKLKLFFMSVLWRAAASERPEFDRVRLGPHQESLRVALCANDPLSPESYSVVAERYLDGDLTPVMPFASDRIDGVNFQVALFGGCRFWIKCDQRPTPSPFRSMQLSPSQPFVVLLSEFKTSKIRTALSTLAKSYHAIHGDPWHGRAGKT